jgi:hypothetical protein
MEECARAGTAGFSASPFLHSMSGNSGAVTAYAGSQVTMGGM